MSKSLKALNIRELSLPLVGRQFAVVTKTMDGLIGSKPDPASIRSPAGITVPAVRGSPLPDIAS